MVIGMSIENKKVIWFQVIKASVLYSSSSSSMHASLQMPFEDNVEFWKLSERNWKGSIISHMRMTVYSEVFKSSKL